METSISTAAMIGGGAVPGMIAVLLINALDQISRVYHVRTEATVFSKPAFRSRSCGAPYQYHRMFAVTLPGRPCGGMVIGANP